MHNANTTLMDLYTLHAVALRFGRPDYIDTQTVVQRPVRWPSLPGLDGALLYAPAAERRRSDSLQPLLPMPPDIAVTRVLVIVDLPEFIRAVLPHIQVSGVLTPLQRRDLGDMLLVVLQHGASPSGPTTAQGCLKTLIRGRSTSSGQERHSLAEENWRSLWGVEGPPVTPSIALQCVEFATRLTAAAHTRLVKAEAAREQFSNAQAVEATHGVNAEQQLLLLQRPMAVRALRAAKRRLRS